MARKVQISKDIILQAALEMLIEGGYSSINIKTLSQKIGCSTQPLVWHFQNMEGLRKALADYALSYTKAKIRPSSDNPIEAFEQIGIAYIKIAVKEPNLFQFIYLNGSGCYPTGDANMLIEDKNHAELLKMISGEFQISEQDAGQYLQNTIIYTHGIAALVATGMMRLSVEEIITLIKRAGTTFHLQAGILLDKR